MSPIDLQSLALQHVSRAVKPQTWIESERGSGQASEGQVPSLDKNSSDIITTITIIKYDHMPDILSALYESSHLTLTAILCC